MNCKLISVSKPVIEEAQTAEDLVAYCARVSNPANQANSGSAAGLLKYLIRNQHWSPFEMVSLTIEINTTRDIARQILRHRSFSFQEFSQRYAEVLDFAEPREARLQDTKNRQNSFETDDLRTKLWWEAVQEEVIAGDSEVYKDALDRGIAKEVARSVLPEGLTASKLYMAGTLRSWIHYCTLRRGNGTQKEHKEIAETCWRIIGEQFPSVIEALQVDDLEEAVNQFRDDLLARLRVRAREGKSGWQETDWRDTCLGKMHMSAADGDPLDTAGYAVFANYHGWNK